MSNIEKSKQISIPQHLKKIFVFKETAVLLTILLISVILTILSPHFLTVSNMLTVMRGLSSD